VAIKPQSIDTYRITGSLGAISFSKEFTGTREEALAEASRMEAHDRNDGIFRRGHARVQMWTGSSWDGDDQNSFARRSRRYRDVY
jgi:hypothetical protein